MLKIGLDTSALDPQFKKHSVRGIGRYVTELTKSFQEIGSDLVDVTPFTYSNVQSSTCFGRFFNKCIDLAPLGKMTLRQQVAYPVQLRMGAMSQSDILHFPAHMDAPAFGGAKYVLTLLDLIPLIFSDLYKAEQPNWRFHFARWLEIRSIKNASKILAISQCTADDAHRILGIPYEKIEVTPLGVDSSFFDRSSQDKGAIRKRYKLSGFDSLILYVGGIDQRKNIDVLLEIFAQVKEKAKEQRDEKVGLVLLGSIRKEKQYPKLCQQCETLGIVDDVVMPGFVPDEDLIALYQACDLFLFPSLYEGFGFPPLEAMAAGLPVVSSNTSSMPEVLGDAAYYFEPTDVEQGVEAVCRVLFNEQVAAELKEKGRVQARKFTWSRTAEKTLRAYESLV